MKPKNQQYTYRGKPDPAGIKLFILGTHEAKNFIFARISKKSGHGVIHFSSELPVEFFQGIISEYQTKKTHHGRPVVSWVKKTNINNEPLDLLVYALCAAFYLKLDQLPESFFISYRKKLKLDDVSEIQAESDDSIDDSEVINDLKEDINIEKPIEKFNSKLVKKRSKNNRRTNNFNFSF